MGVVGEEGLIGVDVGKELDVDLVGLKMEDNVLSVVLYGYGR
ncbi:hypothetical protein [Bacillus thuringiensis]|nr:hypothetical protein [Bacillus thuringiensis]